ncbi:PP2C family serine/threonine-protein phosphatase [Streptomyces zhaozhouensis]|nr:PP2C family serine/threonine-protein phosphatase [Streptomyces zhaozhouensis]
MPQLDQLSACPGCGEPLEEDDRFCGVCGTDLRTAARQPAAPPTDGARERPPGYAPTEHDFPLPPPLHTLRTDGAERPPPPPPPAAPPVPPPPTTPPTTPPTAGAAPDPRAHPPAPPGASPRPPEAQHPPAPQPTDPRGADPRAATTPPAPAARCAGCGRAEAEAEGGRCADCERQRPPVNRDHLERELGGVAAVSDLGLRHHRNEDAFSVAATALSDGTPAVVAVVCDGVSSSSRPHEASAAASTAAAESLLTALPRGVAGPQAMHDAVLAAADAVNRLADAEGEPGRNAPACTLVSAVTTGGQLTVGWVGDSRAYWVPQGEGGTAARLTEDDSWAAQMVAAGLLSEAEAMADHRAHAITAWLGADAHEVEPHTATFQPDRPGVVIVCTDGLWNYAETAEQMARLVPPESRQAPLPSAQHLVRHALDSGGHDNVTVAVIPFPSPRADRA